MIRSKEAGRAMAKGKDLTIRELTLGGLFAALIAAGAFIKITIPVEPV